MSDALDGLRKLAPQLGGDEEDIVDAGIAEIIRLTEMADPYRNLLDIEVRDDKIKELSSRLNELNERIDAVCIERDEVQRELRTSSDAWAKKYNDMHRRCQLAEGAVLRKMTAEQAAGAPLAKRLAIAGYAAEQEARLECERRLDEAKKFLQEWPVAHDPEMEDASQSLWDILTGTKATAVEKRNG